MWIRSNAPNAVVIKHLNLWLDDKQEPPNLSPPQHILDCLGTIENILNKFTSPSSNDDFKYKSYSHGAVYALYEIAQRNNIINIMDSILPDKKRNGLSKGTSLNSCKELIDIPIDNYEIVNAADKDILCYRTKKSIWGRERECFLAFSQKLKDGQIKGLDQELGDKLEELSELKEKLKFTLSASRQPCPSMVLSPIIPSSPSDTAQNARESP